MDDGRPRYTAKIDLAAKIVTDVGKSTFVCVIAPSIDADLGMDLAKSDCK
jgi:hypothetical protein